MRHEHSRATEGRLCNFEGQSCTAQQSWKCSSLSIHLLMPEEAPCCDAHHSAARSSLQAGSAHCSSCQLDIPADVLIPGLAGHRRWLQQSRWPHITPASAIATTGGDLPWLQLRMHACPGTAPHHVLTAGSSLLSWQAHENAGCRGSFNKLWLPTLLQGVQTGLLLDQRGLHEAESIGSGRY